MIYSIDTSSILELSRRTYPRDVFPSLWEQFEAMIEDGIIVASDEVFKELEAVDDEILAWAKQRKSMFVILDIQIQSRTSQIMARYPDLVDINSTKPFADPFVVALAIARNGVVISNEKPNGNIKRPKIPVICKEFNIQCVSTLDFIRCNGWKF